MTCAIVPIFKRRLLEQFYLTRSAVAKSVTVRMDVVFEAAVIKEAAFDKLFEKKTATLAFRRRIPDRANAESLLHLLRGPFQVLNDFRRLVWVGREM